MQRTSAAGIFNSETSCEQERAGVSPKKNKKRPGDNGLIVAGFKRRHAKGPFHGCQRCSDSGVISVLPGMEFCSAVETGNRATPKSSSDKPIAC